MQNISFIINILRSKNWLFLKKSFYKLTFLSLLLSIIEFLSLGTFALIFTRTNEGSLYNTLHNIFNYLSIELNILNLLKLFLFFAGLRLIAIILFARTQVREINYLITDLRKKLFYRFTFLDRAAEMKSTAELSNAIIKETDKVGEAFSYVIEIIKRSLICIMYIVMSLMVDFTFLLIIIISAPILVFISKYFNKFLPTLSKNLLTESERINSFTISFSSISSTIRLLAFPGFILKKYFEHLKLYEDTKNKLDMFGKVGKALPEAIGLLIIAVILLVSHIKNGGQIAEVIFVAGLIYRALGLGISIQYIIMKLLSLSAQSFKIFKNLENFELLKDISYRKLSSNDYLKMKLKRFTVGKTNIENFEIDFQFGNIYLIKGASGVGKSSLLRLISGEDTSKAFELIFSDGTDFHDKHKRPLVSTGILSQDYECFSDSFINNVCLFEPNPDVEKIKYLIDFVELNELLTENENNAINISGGQKQRLLLARALYSDPNILILDEFTSALDTNVEKIILNKIKKIKKDKLIFIISHSNNIEEYVDVVLNMSSEGISVSLNVDGDRP
jgi:ABC-type bacteriocin/lantibiotic exporter with double-glycine peptidase domain